MPIPSITFTLRQQHVDISSRGRALTALLDTQLTSQRNAFEARASVASLAGLVKAHLAMEDRSLYPRLVHSPDPHVAATAQRFVEEIGAVARVFDAYCTKWHDPLSIQKSPSVFADETRAVLEALAERISMEETELFLLADRAAA